MTKEELLKEIKRNEKNYPYLFGFFVAPLMDGLQSGYEITEGEAEEVVDALWKSWQETNRRRR